MDPEELAHRVPLLVGTSAEEFIGVYRSGRIGSAGPDHLCAFVWLIDAEGMLLLVEHPRYGWSCPGGHVEAGETLAEAAVRELAEEIGLAVAVDAMNPLSLTRSRGCLRSPTGAHWSFGFVARATGTPAVPLASAEPRDACSVVGILGELGSLTEPKADDLFAVAHHVQLHGWPTP